MSGLSLHVFLRVFLIFWVVLTVFDAAAQRNKEPVVTRRRSSIVNDSVKNVYGPNTSRWTTENELFESRPVYRPLDTAVINYHRWTYIERSNNMLKDIGVMGTALNSIFPQVPGSIGAQAGYSVYQPYFDSAEPKYFDTKSPYTRLQIIWGGNGRAMTRIEFSRNINPRWNFGFNYRPILVDKQIQKSGKGDRIVVSHYYDFYTTYRSKNDRYFLLANFRRLRHRVNENGGVDTTTAVGAVGIFDPTTRLRFAAAKTEEYRRTIHFSQHYQLVKAFQVYHIADFTKQWNIFGDDWSKDPATLFDYNTGIRRDSATVSDQSTFTTTQQEVGIKGSVGKLFYSGHYRYRYYSFSNPDLSVPETTGSENYLGGTISLKLDSVTRISGSADYLLSGYYRIEGAIESPWLEGYFRSALSKPGFMQLSYMGAHDSWSNAFSGISSTQAQGFLKYGKGEMLFKAGATLSLLHNNIYFKENLNNIQQVLPYQSTGFQSTFAPEVKASVRFLRHVYLRPQVVYTQIIANDDDVLRIPTVFVNGQLAYENVMFNKHLQLHAGVDFHWHSDYKALAYDPVIQQFYIQDQVVSKSFPLVDLFVVGKMGRTRYFFKYHNLFQMINGGNGYLPTPRYPGTRNMIDFGFEFLLFD
jgi:hypothetical protein